MVVGECEDRQTTNRLLFRAPAELCCPLNKSDRNGFGYIRVLFILVRERTYIY